MTIAIPDVSTVPGKQDEFCNGKCEDCYCGEEDDSPEVEEEF
jgi:hypothetical protein